MTTFNYIFAQTTSSSLGSSYLSILNQTGCRAYTTSDKCIYTTRDPATERIQNSLFVRCVVPYIQTFRIYFMHQGRRARLASLIIRNGNHDNYQCTVLVIVQRKQRNEYFG